MYLLSISGPLTLTRRSLQAATAAATTCVLPHPGGPYSSTPVRSLKGALRHAKAQPLQPTAITPGLCHAYVGSRS